MRTIREYVERRAAERPDAVYLIAPETGAVMTYGELGRASRELAGFLDRRGLAKGDKVALMLGNGYQTARLLIGVMYGGCTVAPLNLLAGRAQLAHVLDHSDAKLVFTSADLEPRLQEALASVSRAIDVVVIDPDATAIVADEAVRPSTSSGRTDVSPEDEALLMYTSGTTGTPKGVLLTHASVVAGGA